MPGPAIAFVGDDFTGASDTLATLARGGLRTRLYTGVPGGFPDNLDAIGVATELRAMAPEEGRALMGELAPRIAALRARITHLKICSTFDSSPQTGNIAVVADVLAEAVKADIIAIIGGQPSLKRYCLFGTLFAGASDGQVHRIDRHPVMKNHPITPMHEADLRRHLALQGWADVGLVDCRAYENGAETLLEDIARRLRLGERRLLFDVSSQSDLAVIGHALWDISSRLSVLCIGASSVAEAIVATLCTETAAASERPLANIAAPVLAISGSRSPTTAAQIASATTYQRISAPPPDFLPGPASKELTKRCVEALEAGQDVLVAVSAGTENAVKGRILSRALAEFVSGLVGLARPGCLVVAGGDTSSAVVSALKVEALEFVQDISPGVALVRASGGYAFDGLPMVLKGGQMGDRDFFDKLRPRRHDRWFGD